MFQPFFLRPTYSAGENVDLMLRLGGVPRQARQKRVAHVLVLLN
jgi:ABC-type lipoprotein export system ATPase subunit